jgi:tetratricopeptide (TPR) repeat protein
MKSQISVSQTYISAFNKFKSGDYKSSINYCQKALVIEKNSLVYHLLGVSFARLKLYNDAIYNIKEAINILPSSKIYIDLGDIYRELKDYKNAIDFYKLALKLEPENSNAYYSTATILHKIGNFSSALKMLVNALTYDPNNIKFKLLAAKCLDGLNEFNASIDFYNEILKIEPNNILALLDKADLLRRMFRYDEAINCAQLSLKLDKMNINCYLINSVIYRDLKNIDESIKYLDLGLKFKPNSPQALFNKSVMLLGKGDYEKGWDLYESRWKLNDWSTLKNFTSKPIWNKNKNKNKVLLIWPEQGIGDEVMFSSILNDLKNDVENIIVKSDPRLLTIFKRSFPYINFISSKEIVSEDMYDFQLPIGSLARFYRRDKKDFFNKNNKFLLTNPYWDNILLTKLKNINKRKIGISWKSTNPLSGLKRSTSLEDLLFYIGDPNACYINLQYGDVNEEITVARNLTNFNILNIEEIDNKNNIDGLLSLIAACDEVISVDNSTVHFSGSIGVPTEVLLHSTADFRWELESNCTNWYRLHNLKRNIIL